ncbi:MAG: hypothetical protein IJX12_06185 [Lachnospiraceae bacterium]|nr:hypothetical protein [Lachnospiraceae bacterium]
MKKLFLYLFILIAVAVIFVLGFVISRDYFRENSYKVVIETTEELTTRATVEVIDYLGVETLPDEMEEYNTDFITYRLGELNGYLVVYRGKDDVVYEYTDIQVDLLKKLDYDVYMKVQNNVEFDTKEELFIFLESIDS